MSGVTARAVHLACSLDIVNSSCDITEMTDALGFIRVNIPRYTLAGQLKAMHINSVLKVIRKGGKLKEDDMPEGMQVLDGDIDTIIRMAAPGRLIAVQHAHLLADPEQRRKRGGTRQDFRRTWEAIHQKDAIVWELYTGRRSDKANDREAIALDAVEALAMGRHKTRHTDKRGRPAKQFSVKAWDVGKARWFSRRIKTWAQVGNGLLEGMTPRDLYDECGPRDGEEE